jgi:hypothetical protein
VPFSRALDLLEHWEIHPPASTALAILLGAFTTWEPKHCGPRAPDPDDLPIAGVDYQQTGTTFDNLPVSVQAFLQATKKSNA